jgi:hypothetical protein
MGYGYHWWALPHLPTGIHAGAFLAIGAFEGDMYPFIKARFEGPKHWA